MYNPKLHFYFCGIGGSGMSGIAEVLLNLGFKVSGSDLKINNSCKRLEKIGARIFTGHAASNLPTDASLLVFSSAVQTTNPELVEASRRGIPIVRRAEVLAELMRLRFGVAVAGSHGKTTTTSMIATIMEAGGLDPTVVVGGCIQSMSSGARLGKSEYLVAETDESDRSFLLLKPTLAVVTNIDAEHLSAYDSLRQLEESFEQFVNAVPFYGLAVLCIDDLKVRDLAKRYTRRQITYGFSLDAQLRAGDTEQDHGTCRTVVYRGSEVLFPLALPIPGRHMVQNALAAIAVGLEFGIDKNKIRDALENFKGVERRMELKGEVNGIKVFNDYGHHPTEIKATLAGLKAGWKNATNRIFVVFEPHRYTRTRDCFIDFITAFRDCDELLLAPIYAASEEPIAGITSERLYEAIDHPAKVNLPALNNASQIILPKAVSGDIIVCLGAGPIGGLPDEIIAALQQRRVAA